LTEPSGDPSQHTSAIENAVRQIEEIGDQMVDDFNALVDKFNDNAWWLGASGAVGAAALLVLSDQLEDIKDKLDEILDIVGEVLAHYTPVISLINISFHWLDAVKRPVSGMSPVITGFADANLAYWTGGTADYYNRKVVPPQNDAVMELSGKAGFISEWLYGIALTNVEYATELAEVVGTLAGKVAEAVIKAGSIIDIPFAINDLASLVGELVRSSVTNLTGIADRVTEAGENVRQIVSDRVDESKFPGGVWPQAVAG